MLALSAPMRVVLVAAAVLAVLGCDQPSAKHKAAGNLHFKQARYAEAKAEYEKAVRANPKDAGSHILLGNAEFELGDYAGARASFEAALASDPKAREAHRGLAIVTAHTAKPGDRAAFDEFLRHIQTVIDQAPRDRNAVVSAAQVLSEHANPADESAYQEAQQRAEAYLRDALKIDDRDPKTLFQLALVYARKGDQPTALRVVDRLGQVSPNPGHAPYAAAAVHAILGDRDAALASVELLLALDQIDPESLRHDALMTRLAADPRFLALLDAANRRRAK